VDDEAIIEESFRVVEELTGKSREELDNLIPSNAMEDSRVPELDGLTDEPDELDALVERFSKISNTADLSQEDRSRMRAELLKAASDGLVVSIPFLKNGY